VIEVSDQEFDDYVSKAIDDLPERYIKNLKNVAIVIEDAPTIEQRQRLHLHNGQLLFGLYEGVPGAHRLGLNSGLLPDKISIFKLPIQYTSNDRDSLIEQVRYTVWHEVAHYFGLNHADIDKLDSHRRK
jgi:predicted Zn-dependent protease with MMP-like domain